MTLQANRPMRLHIGDVRRDFNLQRNDIARLHDSALIACKVGVHRKAMAVIDELVLRLYAIQHVLLRIDEAPLLGVPEDEIKTQLHQAIDLSDLSPDVSEAA
jgi:hypothetical protein